MSFDIFLDKTYYTPSEKVTGKISMKAEKVSKARQLILMAEGKESTFITVSESNGVSSGRDRSSRTYSEVNTFFSEDLSYVLQKSLTFKTLSDGTLEILPQNKEFAFDFVLPSNDSIFSSYKGKHAKISYTVKATADKANMLDINKEVQFSVINPNNNNINYNKVMSSTTDPWLSHDDTTLPDNIHTTNFEEKADSIEISEKEDTKKYEMPRDGYSARFEQIFGRENKNNTLAQRRHKRFSYITRGTELNVDLGTIFAKGREYFLKESSGARIELSGDNKSRKIYSRGETIKGNIILQLSQETAGRQLQDHEKMKRSKIRGMRMSLYGVENAFAQGFQRTNTIEKYKEDIDIYSNRNENDNIESNKIPFEFQIPEAINQSYVGEYSEYFWGLEAKVNIAWTSDITSR
ncbi:MAG: hypothetical protein M3261_03915, partial [Thermoproteota archaeon]|nr:hypothetical protein [Thermoproteota archaeon]